MAELRLKVVNESGEGLFDKAVSNFSKVIYSSGAGLYGFVISSKRNALLKVYASYKDYTNIADEGKRNAIVKKYEKAYQNYLDTLEKYLKENIYHKVQKKVGTLQENKLLSQYYEVVALKGTQYDEYKPKRQILLLDMDWEILLGNKSNAAVSKYKPFYITTIDQIYKSMMRHYAVVLTDKKNEQEDKYHRIYQLVENYIKNVLPYKEETPENNLILEAYKKYVTTIDVYTKKTENGIKKNLVLLELSRKVFSYSLPMVAAEQCYLKLIEDCRVGIENAFLDIDKFELYQLLINAMESYHENILSKKNYWDSPILKEEYETFWDKFQNLKKLERVDLEEYQRQREILFVTYDIQALKKEKKKHEEVRLFYRMRLKEIGGFRRLKNHAQAKDGRWRTKRRVKVSD